MSHDLACYGPGGHSQGQSTFHVRLLLPVLDALRVRHGLSALDQALAPAGFSFEELSDPGLWLSAKVLEQLLQVCRGFCTDDDALTELFRQRSSSAVASMIWAVPRPSVRDALVQMQSTQAYSWRGSEYRMLRQSRRQMVLEFSSVIAEGPLLRRFRLARLQSLVSASGGGHSDVVETSYHSAPEGTSVVYTVRFRLPWPWRAMLLGAWTGLAAEGLAHEIFGAAQALPVLLERSSLALLAGALLGGVAGSLAQRKADQKQRMEVAELAAWMSKAGELDHSVREMQHVYRRVVRLSGEGILTLDEAGNVDFANPRAAALLGAEVAALHGRPVNSIFDADVAAAHREIWDNGDDRAEVELNAAVLGAGDGARSVRLNLSLIRDEAGKIEAVLLLVSDRQEIARAKRAQAQSARLLQALVSLGQDAAVLVDPDGHVRYATENMRRLFDVDPLELLDKDLAVSVHEGDQQALRELIGASAPGQESSILLRFRHGGGGWRWVRAIVNHQLSDPDLAGVLVHLRDVTAQMEAEAAIRETEDSLRRSEQHFRMLIESTSDIVAVLDNAGRPLYINPAGTAILGHGLADLKDKSVLDLVLPAERAEALRVLAKAAAGPTVSMRVNVRHKDGHYVLLQARGRYSSDPENRTVMVLSAHDITHQVALEEREHQDSKMEAIGRLAGGIAHDFNNLLTVIQGNAELALGGLPPDSPAKEMLQEIGSAAERASDLTNQLLAFGRKKMLKLQVLEMNSLIEENLSFLKRILGADIKVSTRLQKDLGCVRMDAGHLTQVLLNLVANARDAMPKGGVLNIVTAAVEIGPQDLLAHPDWALGRFVRLTVEDSGSGMDAATMQRIFEPYFTTRGRGNGLGLATVFGIIKQGGGFLSVASEPGHGSVFQVYLPWVPEERPQREPAPLLAGHTAVSGTVLVVDDEHAVRRIAVLGLIAAGFEVLEASNGDEALAIWHKARFHGHKVGLVLTDVIMPRMTGLQLAEQIRSEDPQQRILLMSGFNEGVLADRQGEGMSWPLLHKPFKVEKLVEDVRNIIESGPQSDN